MELVQPAPRPAYFDAEARAWILSLYADVMAALHEPALHQEQTPGKRAVPHAREQVFAALSEARLAGWQSQIETLARRSIDAVPSGRTVDLVQELIRPWTREIAILTLPRELARHGVLRRILRQRGSAGPFRVFGKLGNARFELFFRGYPGEKSAFIGLTETLPAFLANACLALLRNPQATKKLRDDPSLIPAAIEELLRHAGLVHSLARRAASEVEIAGVKIASGDRVVLKLGAANRDPQQFPDPERMNCTRRVPGHLALGHGEHACPGALPLRTACIAMMRPFVERFTDAQVEGEIRWTRGDTLASPSALPVRISQ